MADVNANIGVNIDASDALAQLKQLQRQISQFHSSIQKSSEQAALAQRNLQKNFLNSINSISGFSAELRTVRTTAESFTNSLEKNKFGLGEYFRYAGASTKTFGKLFTNEFNTIEKVATERVKTLQTQYVKMGRDASGAMQAIAIRPTILDMNDLSTRTQIAAQKQALFNQLVKQGSTNLLNFGKNTQWAGRQLMVGFTLPLATLGTVAVKTFMEMEAQVIKFRKVYGDLFTPSEERDQALEDIQSLASGFTKYGVAASETVGLAAEAAAAGLSGLDLQRQVTQATRLSVLGQVDSQKALETTIALQNAFKISSEDLADSINFLNAVENQTVVSLEDVTTAIPKVAPVIRQLGGDVKDMAFFLAAMKEGGINASEGANALKSGLAALINPTDKAAQMLGELGINIRGIVERNAGDLSGLMTEFGRALDGLDPLNRARAIEQLFGKFQFARVSTLFENIIRDGNQASRVLDLSSASLEELAGLAEQELGMTAESAMNKFTSAVEQLQVALVPIGEVFLNVITPIIEKVAEITSGFSKLPEGVQKAITAVVTVVGGLGPIILMTFGLLANGIANSIKFIAMLRNGYLKLTGQSQILGASTEYLTQEQLEASAVAASLDQAHARLTQRFTAEAAAVEALRKAYLNALAAANKFAAVNPGMMKPGAPKKFASGGFVGGSGSGDTVPAMLTPGEFVMNKAATAKMLPFLQALNAGKVSGFNKGGLVGGASGGEFAHITDRVTISLDQLVKTLESGSGQVSQSVMDMVKDFRDTFGPDFKAHIYSGLGFTQSKKLNIGMRDGGAVGAKDFLADFDAQGLDKWTQTLNNNKLKIQDVSDELIMYDKQLADGVAAMIKQNKNATITSEQFAMLEKEVRNNLPATSKLKKALDDAANGLYEFRINVNEANVKAAGLDLYQVPSGADPSKMSTKKRFRMASGREARTGGSRGIRSAPMAVFNDGLASSAQTASESKRTKKIAKDTVDGYANELKRGQKKVTQAARYRDPVTGKFAKKPADVVPPEVTKGVQGFGTKLMGASFALSTVAGTLSMFDGAVGEAAGIMFQLSSAMFGVITTAELMKNTKIGQEIGDAFLGGRGGLTGVKGVMAGLKGLWPIVTKVGSVFLRFLPVIGAAVTAFAVFKIFEAQKEKIQALGNAANFSADQITSLGQKLGQAETRTADFGSQFTAGQAATQETRTATAGLVADEEFGKEYKAQIEAIKTTSKEQAERTLAALATQLSASGFDTAAVDAVINALVQKAGRTDLNLSFAKINFADPAGLQSITDIATDSAKAINDQFTQQPWGAALQTQIQASAGEFTSLFQALKMGFEGGEISADEFNARLADIREQLGTLDPLALQDLIPEIAKKLGIEEQIGGLKSYKDQLLLIEAAAAGITVPAEDIETLKKAESGSAKTQSAALRLRKQLNSQIKQTTKLKEQEAAADAEREEYNQAIASAQEDIASQIESLENQNAAYQILIDAGWGAADAIDAVSNSTFANALAAANGAGDRAQLIADMERLRSLQASSPVTQFKSSGGGGGGTKSPFAQAKEDLIEQRKEAQNTMVAYAKLRDAGLSVADAFAAAEDPILAAAFATTKPGTAKWKELLVLLKQSREQAEALEKLEIAIKVQTDFDGFLDDMVSKAMEYFDILERHVEYQYRGRMEKEKKIIEAAEKEITALQRKISEQERAIELDFNRPIEALQEESSDLANDLSIIDQAAKKINERYDAQLKALSEVKRINQDITNQQKTQISLADALSQGDISQAAALMQTMRGQAAAASATSLESALGAARESEIGGLTGPGGMTRAQIEQRQFEISQQIYDLEEKREAKQRAIRDLQDQVYSIETGRLQNAKDRLDRLQQEIDKQLEAIDKQRQKWEDAQLAQDLANIKAGKYNDVLRIGKLLVGDIVNRWNSIKDRIVKLYIQEVRIPAGASIPSSSSSSSSNKPAASTTPQRYVPSYASSAAAAYANKKMYGGVVKKMARGGVVGGTGMGDVVPTLLTPGEFVVNKHAAKRFMPHLKQMNGSKFPGMMGGRGFSSPTYNEVKSSNPINSVATTQASSNVDNSAVYNYNLTVSVNGGGDMDANKLANVVMTRIKQMDGYRIRRQSV